MELKSIFRRKRNSVIDAYRNVEANLISFEDLKSFIVGETVDLIKNIPGAVICTRLPSRDSNKSLSFRVEMKQGYKWNPHFHDCFEVIVVYKGVCKDLNSGKIANSGQQMIIKPGIVHEIMCTSNEAIFYVEFYKVEE